MDSTPPGSSVHEIPQERIRSGLPFPPPGEVSWTEKNKYHVIPLNMWNLKYNKYDLIYETEIDSQDIINLWLLKGKREGRHELTV